ncbi:retrovirus-related pol polyprotein from transposon TNT 1-94, partial [Tanacetum coccineum]
PNLEQIVYSYDDEDVDVEADMTNLDTDILKVWTLVDLPYDKRVTKWVYRNKKDERGIVVRNKARLVAQGYTQEEGIGYDKVFALVARIEPIRLFLTYASFKDFVVYQMDVKSAFLYGKIKEVYVCQPPGFEDPEFLDRVYKVEKALYGLDQDLRAWSIRKEIWTEFEKMMHKKFQISYMGELTFFLGLTLMETSKPLMKDENGEDVDVHLYRSMIGSLMYLTSSRPNIMFAVCAFARFQVTPKVSHLHAMKTIFRYLKGQPKLGLLYPKDSPFDLKAYTDSDDVGPSLDRKSTTRVANSTTEAELMIGMGWKYYMDEIEDYTGNLKSYAARLLTTARLPLELQLLRIENLTPVISDEYDRPSHTKKVFANMRRKGKDFSGAFTPLFPSILASQAVDGEADDTVHEEREDRMERAATTASSLEAEQDSGNIIRTQSMATLKEPIPQGTGSGNGHGRQDTILGDRPAQTRFERLSKQSNDLPLSKVNTLGSGEDNMKLNELMEIYTRLSERVLALENIKTALDLEITNLKKRVKKLEKKKKSRTLQLK